MKAVATILVLAVSMHISGQSGVHNAEQLYRQKKFPQAAAAYRKALDSDKGNAVIQYDLGDAYFRSGDFPLAAKAYEVLLTGEHDPSLVQHAWYNKGVSLSRQNKLEESIEAYKQALLRDPQDNDARINLQKALSELRKKQDPQKENKEQQKNKNQKKDQPPPQSNLNKKQVEQLLRALDQREQEVQQKMMQNRARGVSKPEQDW